MLYKLWYWLVGGCDHRWVIHKTVLLCSDSEMTIPIGTNYHLQCEKCGNIKFRKIT